MARISTRYIYALFFFFGKHGFPPDFSNQLGFFSAYKKCSHNSYCVYFIYKNVLWKINFIFYHVKKAGPFGDSAKVCFIVKYTIRLFLYLMEKDIYTISTII